MNERADAAGYPRLDVDAIIENGDRRVHRRRVHADDDVPTSDDVTPPHHGYSYIVFDQWLDNDRLTLLGMADPSAPNPTFDLLTCSVSQQWCEVTERSIIGAEEVSIVPGQPVG